jgi:hypothetical protein
MHLFGRPHFRLSLLCLALGCSALAETAPRVQLARVPEAGIQPQAFVDERDTVHLVYLQGDPKASDVYYTRRPAGDRDFTKSLRINSLPGSALAVGTVRGARLAVGRNGRVHVIWNGSDQAAAKPGAGSPLLYARLNDAGDAFETQRDLMTSTTHLDGGGAVAADADGHVWVVWHAHRRTGPQDEIDRAVFVSDSRDDGKTFSVERQINPAETGVCGCCGLQAMASGRGILAVLYRSADAVGNRDTVLLLSTNFGSSFTARTLGRWHVSTCPMSTHALARAGRGLIGAWENEGQVYFGPIWPNSAELARQVTFSPGDAKNRKHPSLAVSRRPGGPQVVAWTEGTGWERGGSLAWMCLDAEGNSIGTGRQEGVPVWGSAAVVPEGDGSFTIFY